MKITKTTINTTLMGSKLYKSSKHKDVIANAIDSPFNKELVMQLAKYITVPTVDIAELDVNTEEDINIANLPDADIKSTPGGNLSDKFSDTETMLEPTTTVPTEPSEEETSTENEVAESINVDGTPITASEKALTEEEVLIKSLDSIVGILNADATTAGVRRATYNNSELWIYYNDNINLNNVMEDVISRFNSVGYNLEFNRLARTSNAIVFTCLDNVSTFYDGK